VDHWEDTHPPAQAAQVEDGRVYVCSNPACGVVHAADPNGHCPACIKRDGVGWSTLPRKYSGACRDCNVPDGWVLVPKIATSAMRLAMAKADDESVERYGRMARAMLAAAQSQGESA